MQLENTKQCVRCKVAKPLTDFHRHKSSRDGLQSYCKPCVKTHFKRWSGAHPDQMREFHRTAYRKHNPNSRTLEQVRSEKEAKALRTEKACKKCGITKPIEDFPLSKVTADGKQYQCKICMSERYRDYYKRNKEKEVRKVRRWQSRNVGATRLNGRRRKARRLGVPGSHTYKQWVALCRRFKNRCVCCGRSGVKLTRDHIVPITHPNSSDDISNIQPLCDSCNASKGNRLCIDYRATPFIRSGQVIMFA